MNPADIAFIIICTGLVMLMTPGLALFYGGLVRSRNVLSTTMHSFITMGIVPVLWFVVGYSLAFGPDLGGIIGGFSHVLLRGVDMEGAGAASGIPPLLFMLFQCMFAVLTLALISGSYAERIHFPAMLLFSILWLLSCIAPWPTGCGAAAGWPRWALWTSRVERWFTWPRRRAASRRHGHLVPGWVWAENLLHRIICL